VLLTSPHKTPHPFFQQPNPMASMHKNMERLICESGLASTFVRPGMFAANALGWWAARIREHDVIRWPYGDAATAPIDEHDIAAVAVHALFDDSPGSAEYMITGPQSLTQREQVATIGEVIGRTLRFEEIGPDDAQRELGFPRAAIDMLLNAWSAAITLPAYVTTTVAEGEEPQTGIRSRVSQATVGSTCRCRETPGARRRLELFRSCRCMSRSTHSSEHERSYPNKVWLEVNGEFAIG